MTSSNKRLSHAVTFAKQRTVPSAALFTDPCDRCFSLFTQSTASSITANGDKDEDGDEDEDENENEIENENENEDEDEDEDEDDYLPQPEKL